MFTNGNFIVLQALVGDTGSLVREHGALTVDTKGFGDYVTQMDLLVQATLMERLHNAFPNAKFFGEEENARDDIRTGLGFIIDPIDGTTNFIHNFGHCAISVGVCDEGEIVGRRGVRSLCGRNVCCAEGEGRLAERGTHPGIRRADPGRLPGQRGHECRPTRPGRRSLCPHAPPVQCLSGCAPHRRCLARSVLCGLRPHRCLLRARPEALGLCSGRFDCPGSRGEGRLLRSGAASSRSKLRRCCGCRWGVRRVL